MAAGERLLERQQLAAQVVGRVAVVMQMNFHLAETGPAQLREPIEIIRLIFLDRKEERIARRPAVAVAEATELQGEFSDPSFDARQAPGRVRAFHLRLVMIREQEQDVDLIVRRGQLTPAGRTQVCGKPAMHMPPPHVPGDQPNAEAEGYCQGKVAPDHPRNLACRSGPEKPDPSIVAQPILAPPAPLSPCTQGERGWG